VYAKGSALKNTQKACAYIHTALSCGPVTNEHIMPAHIYTRPYHVALLQIYTESLCTYTHGPVMRPCYEYTQKTCVHIHTALSCSPVTNIHRKPVHIYTRPYHVALLQYTQKACAHIHTALSCGPVTNIHRKPVHIYTLPCHVAL